MEITIMGHMGIIGVMEGIYWDDGKENGNYHLRFKGHIGLFIGITCRV